jgi:hypothetical protein
MFCRCELNAKMKNEKKGSTVKADERGLHFAAFTFFVLRNVNLSIVILVN